MVKKQTHGLWLAAALCACVASTHAQHADTRPPQYRPQGTALELGLQGLAKVVCSAVYVSGRDIAEAKRNSGALLMPSQEMADKATFSIDREKKIVRMSLDGITREAGFYGDQGCIIHRGDPPYLHFKPVAIKSSLPDAATQPWPMGDSPSPAEPTAGFGGAGRAGEIDQSKVNAAVDAAFADPTALTAGFIVLHKGRIVGERYMPGITKDTQLESWSMGKSIASTLFSLLVKDGTYTLEQAAPVPGWRSEGDPRGKIRNMDLLRMSSGLRFIATQDPDYSPDKGYPDHFYIYTGAVNGYDYSVNQPLQFPPNTEGRYRNSDPLTIMYLAKLAVTKRGEDFMTWPQRALFDRIGIRRQVLETDPYGNFLISGYDYGTARNWARIGQLYLQDGVWQGTRILPEGWAKFVSTPAPAWSRPVYGGLFWVNGDGSWNLPRDAYFAAGAGGQNTFIVPSHQMVIVRMGHARGAGAGRRATNNALTLLMDAVTPQTTTAAAPAQGRGGQQQPPPTETTAPDISGVVKGGTKVTVIKFGFQGTEGPIGMPDGTLIFTETQANRITRIAADGTTSTFLENTNGSNGLGFDAKGRLISVQTTPGQTRIGVIYPKGSEAVITDNFEGKAYGRPNDLIVSTRGAIYFTEPGPNAPPPGTPPPATPPLPPAVYYVAPGATRAVKVAEGIERPNGIMLSRDEKTLFVNNTNGEHLLAFDVNANGTLSNRRNFTKYQGGSKNAEGLFVSGADGLAIDNDGRLYVATAAGVEVVSAKGEHLGVIPLSRAPQNLAFAGKDKKTLYVVGRGAAFKIDLLASGFKGRAK